MKNRQIFNFLTFFCTDEKSKTTKNAKIFEKTKSWTRCSLKTLKEKSEAFIREHQRYEKFLNFDVRAQQIKSIYL